MKKRIMAAVFSMVVLLSLLSGAVPEAQAWLITMEDGTVLDPGSCGLVIEDIDSRMVSSKSEIVKILKSWGQDADYYEHVKDDIFWKVSVRVKNNFPVDLYGIGMMLYACDADGGYLEQWFESTGNTWDESDLESRLKGYNYGDVLIKAGETYTHSFYYNVSEYAFDAELGRYPKYLHVDWVEFCTEEGYHGDQHAQISPYFELDGYKKIAKANGISDIKGEKVKNTTSEGVEVNYLTTGIVIENIDIRPVTLQDVIGRGDTGGDRTTDLEGNVSEIIWVGAPNRTAYVDGFSDNDLLLELNVKLKSNMTMDVYHPQLTLIFYNEDGDTVDQNSEYYGKGLLTSGGEFTVTDYYYVEDPYYIPADIKVQSIFVEEQEDISGPDFSVRPIYNGKLGEKIPVKAIRYQSADMMLDSKALATGAYHTAYVRSDGTVGAAGRTSKDRCKVEDWTDIIAVDAYSHTVGLKSDGTVVATGPNGKKQCNVSKWEDIIAVAVGEEHTVGLKSDGTVVAVGNSANKRLKVSEWQDVIAIDAGKKTTYGLKSDGTVAATGSNSSGQAKVTAWKDIVAISAGDTHVVGLKSDGTLVAAGGNSFGECDVSAWEDIVAIAAGNQFTIGLRSDGTVVATGNNKEGQCDVSDWTDIIAISAGMHHVIGIRADGKYITAGSNGYGQCDIS